MENRNEEIRIDWKSKLTSRKLWMAIIGFATGLLTYLGVGVEKAEQIGSLILMAASIAAYIIGEGWADAAGAQTPQIVEVTKVETKPPEDDGDDGK